MEYVITGTDDPNCFPHHLYRQVGSLTFRWKSPMKLAFHAFWNQRAKARLVWLAAPANPGKVLAWGLLLWHTAGELDATGKAWDPDFPEVMLYVRRGHRKAGLASQVFWALRNSLGGANAPYVYYPHDPKASAFYQRQIERRAAGNVPEPKVLWLAAP